MREVNVYRAIAGFVVGAAGVACADERRRFYVAAVRRGGGVDPVHRYGVDHMDLSLKSAIAAHIDPAVNNGRSTRAVTVRCAGWKKGDCRYGFKCTLGSHLDAI